MTKRASGGSALLVAAISITAMSQAVSATVNPVIPKFGGIVVIPSAAERPDPKLRYRVVFSITKAATSADKLNPSLEKVARFVNLLGACDPAWNVDPCLEWALGCGQVSGV